jgi:SAM-dependent methyltransferase
MKNKDQMLVHTVCPIDGTDAYDVEVYPASVNFSKVDADTFSARRKPDRVHYRMVRNTRTNCLRADPILAGKAIIELYRESRVTYEGVSSYAAETYLRYLRKALPLIPDRRGVLEIGCGNGFFLDRLKPLGFDQVTGIELSQEAISKASPEIRPHIIQELLKPGLIDDETFSLICGFQVLDHLVHPNGDLELCRQMLVPGGMMFWICHDIGSLYARLLGQRCPMIDIEHVVLYDRRTITKLFENNGFQIMDVFGISNRYPLWYWIHLVPLPDMIKRYMTGFLERVHLRNVHPAINFGNMGILARKPIVGQHYDES